MDKIKIFFILLNSIRVFIETKLKKYIPGISYIYNLRDDFLSYELHEKKIFIKHMPSWYAYYELSIVMRIIRVIMGIFLVFSRNIIPYFFEVYFNIEIENSIMYSGLLLFILVIFLFFFSLKFILRFIYGKELVRNSPFNIKNCVIVGMKQLCYPLIVSGFLGLGSNIIDSTSERYGYVPPFQHYSDSMNYYLNKRVSKKIGTTNLEDYELYKGSNWFSSFLKYHEQLSLEKRKEMIKLYNCEQQGQQMISESQNI